jgi:hypothetical protein
VAGLFSVRSLEDQLLDVQERSMVQQGRLVAAALSGAEVDPEHAHALIVRLGGRSESRIRVVGGDGKVVADSAATPLRIEKEPRAPESPLSRESPLYRMGVTLWKPFKSAMEWMRRPAESTASRSESDVTPQTIVSRALEGPRHPEALRVHGRRPRATEDDDPDR